MSDPLQHAPISANHACIMARRLTPTGVLYPRLVDFLCDHQYGLLCYERQNHRFLSGSGGILSKTARFICTCGVCVRLFRCDSSEFPGNGAGFAWFLPFSNGIAPCVIREGDTHVPRAYSILTSFCLTRLFDHRFGPVFASVTREGEGDLSKLEQRQLRRFNRSDQDLLCTELWRLLGISNKSAAQLDRIEASYEIKQKAILKWRSLFCKQQEKKTRTAGSPSAAPSVESSEFNVPCMIHRRMRMRRSLLTLYATSKTVTDDPQVGAYVPILSDHEIETKACLFIARIHTPSTPVPVNVASPATNTTLDPSLQIPPSLQMPFMPATVQAYAMPMSVQPMQEPSLLSNLSTSLLFPIPTAVAIPSQGAMSVDMPFSLSPLQAPSPDLFSSSVFDSAPRIYSISDGSSYSPAAVQLNHCDSDSHHPFRTPRSMFSTTHPQSVRTSQSDDQFSPTSNMAPNMSDELAGPAESRTGNCHNIRTEIIAEKYSAKLSGSDCAPPGSLAYPQILSHIIFENSYSDSYVDSTNSSLEDLIQAMGPAGCPSEIQLSLLQTVLVFDHIIQTARNIYTDHPAVMSAVIYTVWLTVAAADRAAISHASEKIAFALSHVINYTPEQCGSTTEMLEVRLAGVNIVFAVAHSLVQAVHWEPEKLAVNDTMITNAYGCYKSRDDAAVAAILNEPAYQALARLVIPSLLVGSGVSCNEPFLNYMPSIRGTVRPASRRMERVAPQVVQLGWLSMTSVITTEALLYNYSQRGLDLSLPVLSRVGVPRPPPPEKSMDWLERLRLGESLYRPYIRAVFHQFSCNVYFDVLKPQGIEQFFATLALIAFVESGFMIPMAASHAQLFVRSFVLGSHSLLSGEDVSGLSVEATDALLSFRDVVLRPMEQYVPSRIPQTLREYMNTLFPVPDNYLAQLDHSIFTQLDRSLFSADSHLWFMIYGPDATQDAPPPVAGGARAAQIIIPDDGTVTSVTVDSLVQAFSHMDLGEANPESEVMPLCTSVTILRRAASRVLFGVYAVVGERMLGTLVQKCIEPAFADTVLVLTHVMLANVLHSHTYLLRRRRFSAVVLCCIHMAGKVLGLSALYPSDLLLYVLGQVMPVASFSPEELIQLRKETTACFSLTGMIQILTQEYGVPPQEYEVVSLSRGLSGSPDCGNLAAFYNQVFVPDMRSWVRQTLLPRLQELGQSVSHRAAASAMFASAASSPTAAIGGGDGCVASLASVPPSVMRSISEDAVLGQYKVLPKLILASLTQEAQCETLAACAETDTDTPPASSRSSHERSSSGFSPCIRDSGDRRQQASTVLSREPSLIPSLRSV